MPAYRIKQFSGIIPRTDPREVPLNAAQDATNVFLTSGRLDPMFQPQQVANSVSSVAKTIYRLFNGGKSVWLSWNEQVDVAESPVYIANNSRIAFSSPDFEPRQTDIIMANGVFPYPSSWYVLGVTPPVNAPKFTSITGGSGVLETRSYVYTFVTQWGEESAPSPAMDTLIPVGSVTGGISGTTLTVSAVTSGKLSNGNILTGTNVLSGTTVSAQLTSSAAATTTSTYATVSPSMQYKLTVDSVVGLAVGQYVVGTGVPADTTITAINGKVLSLSTNLTANAAGKYNLYSFNTSHVYGSGGAIAANTMVLDSVDNVYVDMFITGVGLPENTKVAAVPTTYSNVYSSGGASATNTVTLTNVTGVTIGQFVSGAGIPANTVVTAISGSTITISNNFTAQATGIYTFNTRTITLTNAFTLQASGTYKFFTYVTSVAFDTLSKEGDTLIPLSSVANLATGQLVTGTGVPVGTTIVGINGTNIAISQALTQQATGTYSFYEAGGVGTYTVNNIQNVPSTAIGVFTDSGYANGTWNISVPDTTPSNSYNITGLSYNATTSVATITLNTVFGLRAYEKLTFTGVVGMTDLNYKSFRVLSVNTSAKTITISLTTSQTYTSGGMATRDAPHNINAMMKRVYRTVSTSTGTDYYQVGSDFSALISTFQDSYTDVGSPLVTTGWEMPPANLQGLITHPSGAMVGFVGNQVYMSTPYSVYSWPVSQISTLDYNVIGLGVFGQTLVVMTDGRPYAITFTDPAAATAQKLDKAWPCVSKRGITTFGDGVYYPTNLGLVYIGAAGASLITETYYAQTDWHKLNPSSFVAANYDNKYYAYYDDGTKSQIVVFSKDIGVSYLALQPTALFTDRMTGEVHMAQNGYVYQINGSKGLLMPYSWKSKDFVEPNPVNMGACKVDFIGAVDPTVANAIAAQNAIIAADNAVLLSGPTGSIGAMNNAAMNVFKVSGSNLADLLSAGVNGYYVSITLYVNGVQVFNKDVKDSSIFRLPAGMKYDTYSIGVTGTAPVKAVLIGGTPMELKSV